MPALSQSFKFLINNVENVSVVYPNTGTTALSFTSEPLQAAGYYGLTEGNHTVDVSVSEITGVIEIQATLEAEPQEFDWFPVNFESKELTIDTTGLIRENNISVISYSSPTSGSVINNFVGNYIWLRVKLTGFTGGTLNKVLLNY